MLDIHVSSIYCNIPRNATNETVAESIGFFFKKIKKSYKTMCVHMHTSLDTLTATKYFLQRKVQRIYTYQPSTFQVEKTTIFATFA